MNLITTLQDFVGRCEREARLSAPYRFCFYGYTDIMLNRSEWLALMPPEKYARLANRENRDSLVKIHNRPDVEKVPTLSSIQEVLFDKRVSIDVFDFQTYEGSEMMVDLNRRVPAELEQRYDAVFDNGTSEHVFNYPQLLMNSLLITKVGGFIRHAVPLNWPNHGFYSVSPTTFHDFYGDNGARTVECQGHFLDRKSNPPQHRIITSLPLHERFTLDKLGGIEISVLYTVQKEEHRADFTYPVQHKYRDASKWK